MVSITARAGGRSSTIQAKRPLFSELWKYYPVKMSASDVNRTGFVGDFFI